MDPQWLKLEAERVRLENQVKLLELRLSKVEGRDVDLSERSEGLDREVERRALLIERAALLKDEVAELDSRFAREREELLGILRGEAVGRSFERLAGARGRTFEEVVITRVTDVGIEFRHATGSARLAAADLTPEQHGWFGIDPGVSGEALQEEQAVARAYDKWVDERVALANARSKEEEAKLLAAEAARPLPQRVVTAAVASDATARLRDEPRSFGRERYTTWYPSYTRSRYSRYGYCYGTSYGTGYGTGYYSRTPGPSMVSGYYPNLRTASSSWSYTPPARQCISSPVIRRTPTFSITRP